MRSWKGSASSSASTNALGNSNSTELSTTRTHMKFPSTTLLPRLDLEGSEMDSDSFASRPLSPTTPGLGLSSTLHSLGQASQPLSSLPDRLDIASTRLMRLKTARMDMLKHRSDGRMDSPRSSMTMNQLTSSLPGTSRTDVGRTRFPRRSHQEPIGLSSTQARQASDPTPVKIHRPQRMLRTSSDQNWTYGHNPIAGIGSLQAGLDMLHLNINDLLCGNVYDVNAYFESSISETFSFCISRCVRI